LRRGLNTKDENYDRFELATKIFTPSYISFETVLQASDVIFQYYQTLFVASYQTKEIVCDGPRYSFKSLKNFILTNNAGIEIKNNYSIAFTERAFLDVLYLNKEYHFDNLSPINWNKVMTPLPIYGGNPYKAIKGKLQNDHILPKSNFAKALSYYYGLVP
jgi:hypothetical protein